MDNWKELTQDFLDEAYTLIKNLEESLLNLEKDLSNKDSIDVVFRVAHTIKGGAGAVGFKDVTKLTHIMEDVLDLVRNGLYQFVPDDISLLLEVRDELETLLNAHEKEIQHPFDKTEQLINSLEIIKKKVTSSENTNSSTVNDSVISIDELPIAARFGLNNEMISAVQDALSSEERLLFIEVRFNEEYELKELGPFELLNIVNGFSEPVIMNPSIEDIDAEYYPYLNIVIACSEPIEYVEQKLSITDVVSKLTVTALDKDLLTILEKSMSGDNNTEEPSDAEIIDEPPLESKTEPPQTQTSNTPEEKRSLSLKVESSKIDDLLNLLGELVIIRSGLSQFGTDLEQSIQKIRSQLRMYLSSSSLLQLHQDPDINIIENQKFQESFMSINTNLDYYTEYSQQLTRISTTLQGRMMQLRMVPIQTVFSRFTRLTRDIAKQLDKKIELVMEGGETEIDKGMIDDLYDPLMHMIRNSLDHGIETPDVRIASGKKETGTIQLKAYQEGDAIFIEIIDDGKGIDPEKIKEKAIAKGFITTEKASTLSHQEILSLIFLPGFSTAEQISNLSGRGVGMDVVYQKIQELDGSVTVFSEFGQGSTIRIQLPLTLAIIQGLLTLIGDIHYIIPIASVEETVIIDPKNLHQFNHYYAIEFREKLIPLIDLPSVMYGINDFQNSVDNIIKVHNNCANFNMTEKKHIEESSTTSDKEIPSTTPSSTSKINYCIIIRYGDRQVGLVVPEILGEQDIVIKPLEGQLISSPGIAAATIVGNGEIGFILNISQIIRFYLRKQQQT